MNVQLMFQEHSGTELQEGDKSTRAEVKLDIPKGKGHRTITSSHKSRKAELEGVVCGQGCSGRRE